MNPSQRRVAVIGLTITAGVSCAGVFGVGTAAAEEASAGAAADRRPGAESAATNPRAGGRVDARSHRADAQNNDRRAARPPAAVRPVRVGAAQPPPHQHWQPHQHWPPHPHWPPGPPCPDVWPILPSVVVLPDREIPSNGLVLAGPLGFPQNLGVATPVFGPPSERVVLGVAASAPEPEPVGAVPPNGPPSMSAAPDRPAATPPRASAQAPPEPARSAGRPVAAPLQQPKTQAPLGDTARLGYPNRLRHADLPAVASMALPGLAAILGFTVAGGFLGYRQARAGSALRAAGTARFLP